MAAAGGKRMKALAEFLLVAATGYSVYYLLTFILRRLENLDPEKSDRDDIARRSSAVLRRLDQNDPLNPHRNNGTPSSASSGGRFGSSSSKKQEKGRRERLPLSVYEQKIVTEVVAPEDIHVTFRDIGGLDNIIEELRESVIYPLTQPHLFAGHSSLLTAPKGVLLYGPPGCGKTMLAKALAKESQACFINLHISTLTEKWYGDSNKMVNAVFSLARKLQPCIIFIDEIDAVLRSRSAQDHEASAMVKAEFMTHWDGLLTGGGTSRRPPPTDSSSSEAEYAPGDLGVPYEDASPRIMVLGATNRMHDIDEAILRRLPKKFAIPLPDAAQRKRILTLILNDTKLDPSFSFDDLVLRTHGFSGSDLKEACRDAAMVPLREMIRRRRKAEEEGVTLEEEDLEVRGVRNSDFFRKESGGKWSGDMPGLARLMEIGIGMPPVPVPEVNGGEGTGAGTGTGTGTGTGVGDEELQVS
ncbi:P-loop containing nucleoside triphosphate hydrolase protein [Kalaharituber pfeilii]|nr:P-loop containing nucleoside triphosphate hydrolase protein [Kalaharituber pfeilii]